MKPSIFLLIRINFFLSPSLLACRVYSYYLDRLFSFLLVSGWFIHLSIHSLNNHFLKALSQALCKKVGILWGAQKKHTQSWCVSSGKLKPSVEAGDRYIQKATTSAVARAKETLCLPLDVNSMPVRASCLAVKAVGHTSYDQRWCNAQHGFRWDLTCSLHPQEYVAVLKWLSRLREREGGCWSERSALWVCFSCCLNVDLGWHHGSIG